MSEQSTNQLYREVLLDHFHHPRNKGDLDDMQAIARGSNPRCGDEVEVGLSRENDCVYVRFRGRGCSVCLASASIMAESCTGLTPSALQERAQQASDWLANKTDSCPSGESIQALDAVRSHPARKRCVLLAWQALGECLSQLDANRDGEADRGGEATRR